SATGRRPSAATIPPSPTSWPAARRTKRRKRMSPDKRAVRVGLVILAAFAVLAVGIFVIGDRNNLFSRKNRYYVDLNSVSGLKPGSPVELNGVDVGTIKQVDLPENPWKRQIRVWLEVESRYAARIRGPRDPESV